MDATSLSRLQFGLTIGFHYIFPTLTIGLAWLLVTMMTRAHRRKDPVARAAARFWVRIFALTFAMGVATGITMEFQFGTNWAAYSRFVGDIFGAPLAAEAVLAFFLESTFLALLLFGERRLSPRVHLLSSWMVALGATLSAFWIIVANSWQQTPAGHRIVGDRAVLVDFMAAVFNPSTLPRFAHAVTGALICGAFFAMGVSAWHLLRKQHVAVSGYVLRVALILACAASVVELGLGHWHAVQVAQTQPAKLAAFEGLFETGPNAPLLLFGIPDGEAGRTNFAVGMPGWLSIGVGGSTDTVVQGLNDIPRDLWPPLLPTFTSFHLMVALGMLFIAMSALGVLLWWRGRLVTCRPFLWAVVWVTPLPVIAAELGWAAAEIGRQPWIVQGLMKTRDAASPGVDAGSVLASIVMFGILYAILFGVWVFLLQHKIHQGPQPVDAEVTV